MIHHRGKALLASGINRRRESAADITTDDLAIRRAQLSQSPCNIFQREPAALPIRNGIVPSETVEIDRDVNAQSV